MPEGKLKVDWEDVELAMDSADMFTSWLDVRTGEVLRVSEYDVF